MASVKLTKAYKNHPKGTELHSVTPKFAKVLKDLGVTGGRTKAIRKPPSNKMVDEAPESKA